MAESRHYPYGAERWTSGSSGFPTDYRFTGQREEAGLGLYHMGARFYDPGLGRWLSADTIVPEPGEPQAFNKYSYVSGNPLKFIDPTGHKEEGECSFNDEGCEGQPTLEDEIVTLLERIYYPNRTEPLMISLPDGTLLIVMPVNSDPMQSRPPLLEDTGDLAAEIGIGLDWAELAFVAAPVGPSLGALDATVTLVSSFASGESLAFEQPDPSLPSMFALGQDVLWTGGVDYLVPWAGGGTAAAIFGPEAAPVGEIAVDACTTIASLFYDNWRYYGGGDSSWKSGWMFGSDITPVVMFYPGKPNK